MKNTWSGRMNNFEKIKQMNLEEMAKWLEDYTRTIITTLANQMLESSKPEATSSTEFKKLLLQEVNNDR